MAKKQVFVSDMSNEEIPEGTGALVTIKYNNGKRGVRVLDVTDAEADALGGREVKRRGRPPKVQSV